MGPNIEVALKAIARQRVRVHGHDLLESGGFGPLAPS
jgi:hypothetical protein